MAVNDFYLHGEGRHPYPLGNLQLLGKLQAGMLTANQRWVPRPLLDAFAQRSVDWWVMSEDLPHPDNRVTIDSNGGIVVHWKPTNLKAHARLTEAGARMLPSSRLFPGADPTDGNRNQPRTSVVPCDLG